MGRKLLRRFVCLAGILAVFAVSGLGAAASTTDTIPFQARVTSSGGGPPPDGAYRVSFTVFDEESGGDPLWTETQFTVFLRDGVIATRLGLETPLPAEVFSGASGYWVEIAVDLDSNGLDAGDIHSPRTALSGAPVAFQAKDAGGLGGVPGVSYARLVEVYTKEAADAILAARNTLIGLKADAVDVQAQLDALDTLVAAKALPGDAEAGLAGKQARTGENYIAVPAAGTALENGEALLAAYAEARERTPNGEALSAANRLAVLVPPGRYDLADAPLVLDTEFVDLIGLTTSREGQWIRGAPSALGTGVVMQSADNVRIENLTLEIVGGVGSSPDQEHWPAAYFPESNLPGAFVKNCAFLAFDTGGAGMRTNIEYSGTYIDCYADTFSAFGGRGDATGVFIRCEGQGTAFGAGFSFDNETLEIIPSQVSGLFIDCVATQDSFGTTQSIVSGTFINCRATRGAFGSGGTASGLFIDCYSGGAPTIPGFSSFGGLAGVASGIFIGCEAGNASFGGISQFGSGAVGEASGYFERCVAGERSFGGHATGTFKDCIAGPLSFGSTQGAPTLVEPLIMSGTFIRCRGGSHSFGGGTQAIDWSSPPRLISCEMNGTAWTGVFNGIMENSRWNHAFNTLMLGDSARVYNSTILGNLDLADGTAGIAHNRLSGAIQNADNAAFNAFNLTNAGVE